MATSDQTKGGGRPAGGSDRERGKPDESLAIALAYEPVDGAPPPRVIATGRGAVADQIIALAFAHGVKVRQDADLARVLSAVDLDSEIPVEAFVAVAEILAYVYRANRQAAESQPEAPLAAEQP
ncbi:EscU/YscU/HrcU family type III secretion system export apparatus switch protein [Rhodospirillum rubrum]|uniref:Uncharacterized protein n=1 Tax=Rhodospirillum rubrum (strain ATCC 11170 / ATH 1.1.1 / DSM 467 / LMG 4362 / NCIMB 8255 / S1) TaxID=269796 RepID=Q2RQH1_RHORT|nr:EscU/YscU/HrcU family type III secretion system export apparatus switch protein [Rhodospirillum rubrum]ABC23624.1 conserved hypothetical protein [Rhodospirillum rubrum ATCC 11170]AEO49362.1 hypothetical protein F11_14500 [Rhodospirillum rubrum F11]MBK5955301.1 hypothetical protein [Rhodospirillum rubrum]QXG79585.1 EscU/YscU/HrcU family type III secretion system export apparatus switch protein [Rhodospirillum rubrum]HCF18073.1 hypothetical protein [Rhodospirillum rubrum]